MCQNCLPQWRPAIAASKKNIKVKKGQVIFNEGDIVKGVYFVYGGIVKVHKKWGAEKELLIRFASNGAIFGHRGLGGNNLYPISATALEDSTICFVEIDFFESTMRVNPNFTYSLMMFFASELQESEKKMRNLAHMPVKGRVAQALTSLQNQFGTKEDGSIKITLSRQDLASYTGTTYETVFRVLTEMQKEEIIEATGKKIIVIDQEKLLGLTAEQL